MRERRSLQGNSLNDRSRYILLNALTILIPALASFGVGWFATPSHLASGTEISAVDVDTASAQLVSAPNPAPLKTAETPEPAAITKTDTGSLQRLVNDPRLLIQLPDMRSVLDKRAALVKYIWPGKGFPVDRLPDLAEPVKDSRFGTLTNAGGITRLTVQMPFGVNSSAFLFDPQRSNNRLMIYHQGHGLTFVDSNLQIDQLLGEGYSVLALDMPLTGVNNMPVVSLPRFGTFRLQTHNQMTLLESDNFSMISFFMEPVAAGLNYAVARRNLNSIRMMGLSGGGWATTLYAAIDTRVDHSYPVAGSMPIYDRGTADFGDYEQNVPGLYRIANYLELYVLGSLGRGRHQLQVLNSSDPCCFAGERYSGYGPAVQARIDSLGRGSFEVIIDDTQNAHAVSEATFAKILHDD